MEKRKGVRIPHMIFFLINIEKNQRADGYFTVPRICPKGYITTNVTSIRLAPWNEVRYEGVPVNTADDLKKAVIDAARKDPICAEMNGRALSKYGIYLYPPDGFVADEANCIAGMDDVIMRILTEWAHPMIGNIMNSPFGRPQTTQGQCQRWNTISRELIDEASRARITALLSEPPAGLGRLQRTGHDQVRLVWDMQTLARAFAGEITTLATRRLEKLFALDLCRSDVMAVSQMALLAQLLEKINQCSAGILLKQFQKEFRSKKGFAKEEYIKYYFKECTRLSIEDQVIFYIALIERAVGAREALPGLAHPARYEEALASDTLPIKAWLLQWNLLPPVIRCAVIQNSIRKFLMGVSKFNQFSLAADCNRFSMNGSVRPDGSGINASICPAAEKVLTVLEDEYKLNIAWSWNRDEDAESTQFYRKCLLPLWAGPSGHAHGNLDLVLSCLYKKTVRVRLGETEKEMDAASVALASLFALWRLYYDKRTTGVHTIAETFEASIAGAKVIEVPGQYPGRNVLQFEHDMVLETPHTHAPIADLQKDAFSLLLECLTRDGVICPPLLMDVLHERYYPASAGGTADDRYRHLKTLEDLKREELSVSYVIPLWTKPIIDAPELPEKGLEEAVLATVEKSELLKRLRLFSIRNTRMLFQKSIQHTYAAGNRAYAQKEELRFLYERLCEGSFAFAGWYEELPRTVNGTAVLEELVLENPAGLLLKDGALTFTAQISTEAPFWDNVRSHIPVGDRVLAECAFYACDGGILFTAASDVCAKLKVTETFCLEMSSVVLQSGLHQEGYRTPRFSCGCAVNGLALTASWGIDSSEMILSGEYYGEGVLSLGEILEMAGLPHDLSVLPEELSEGLFGALGLKAFSAQFFTETGQVQRMELTVSTQKPWQLIEDKIALRPFLYLTFEDPFDPEKRETDLQIEGIWTLGTTDFHTVVRPESGELSAFMEEGETLDAQAVQSFIGDVPLPDFSVTGMEFYANYKTGAWSASLEAGKCLSFKAAGTSIEISDVSLSVDCSEGTPGELQMAGCFTVGGISLYLQGRYASGDDWEFSASGAEDTEVSFSGLWKSLADDLPAFGGLEDVIPEDFLSFRIGKIYAGYSSLQRSFCLYIALEEIKITDSFVIDSVLADVQVQAGSKEVVQADAGLKVQSGNGVPVQADAGTPGYTDGASLQSLKLTAVFTAAGLSLQLEIAKTQSGFRIYGGTAAGQSISIGTFLAEFAGDVLGYQEELPEALKLFTIRALSFQYEKGSVQTGFAFLCEADFGGDDPALVSVFRAGTQISVKGRKQEIQETQDGSWSYGVSIGCELEAARGQILKVSYDYDAQGEQKNCISLTYEAQSQEDILTLYDILDSVGTEVGESWSFLSQFGFKKAELSYDFTERTLFGALEMGNGGSFSVVLKTGASSGYEIRVVTGLSLSLEELPVVGGLAGRSVTASELFSVSNFNIYAFSEPDEKEGIPAGVCFTFDALGKNQTLQIYRPPENEAASAEDMTAGGADLSAGMYLTAGGAGSSAKMYWKKLDQTVALFTLHRLGIGVEDGCLAFALDASLNVSPFTFTLFGAGIRVGLSDYLPRFALTGFGMDFKNELMTIGGSLNCTKTGYQGTLIVQLAAISVFAQIWYDTDGSLFAYAAVNGNIGGTPAFFITGLALAFAWNKSIVMPGIEEVAQSPFLLAATGKIAPEEMQTQLYDVLIDENGARTLAAGIRFTMCEIADCCLLLFVRFGTRFELDLLGTAEVSMPPDCPKNASPLAYAKLALKASVKPEEGFAGVEARLTPESYILSKDCSLTGGFAFYLWYQGEHSGDFVITFGGYHPRYETIKPQHYPDVPRVGFLWKIGNCITIDGDMYFALTPSAVMAGGRLSAVYELGPLKAYFIAKVDFYLSWKPFAYDASVGIVIGGSLRIKLLFVSVTLKLELGATLYIWGPDFSARARVSIWIISFEISFGANAGEGEGSLEWGDFCESFLPKDEPETKRTAVKADTKENANPLKISFCSGLTGKIKIKEKEYSVLRPDGAEIAAESVMPVHGASVNQVPLSVEGTDTCVRPMKEKGASFVSEMSVTVKSEEYEGFDEFDSAVTEKNFPSAIWGGEQELLRAPCGIMLTLREREYTVFPLRNYISLDDLYAKGATVIPDAFCFLHPDYLPDYTDSGTIRRFAETAAEEQTERRRRGALLEFGIVLEKPISLKRYAAEAENYLDEEVLIAEG